MPRPTPRPTPSQFDLLVTFDAVELARQALRDLREVGLGPGEAVLMTHGPQNSDELELAADDLRSESWLAYGIVVATELAIGILTGAVIGWLIGLFRNAPQVGPIWQPIVIGGFIGFVLGVIASMLEWRRWRRVHLPTVGQAAIALRLHGPTAPERLRLAQTVLERFGGQRDAG